MFNTYYATQTTIHSPFYMNTIYAQCFVMVSCPLRCVCFWGVALAMMLRAHLVYNNHSAGDGIHLYPSIR